MADKPQLIEGRMGVAAHEIILSDVRHELSVASFINGQLQEITAMVEETPATVFVNGRIELFQSDGSWFYRSI